MIHLVCYYNDVERQRKDYKMEKTNEQIKEELKNRYAHALRNRDWWERDRDENLVYNRKSKAKQSQEFADQYQVQMNTISEIYGFLCDISWTDAIRELREYTYSHR